MFVTFSLVPGMIGLLARRLRRGADERNRRPAGLLQPDAERIGILLLTFVANAVTQARKRDWGGFHEAC